MSFNSPQNSPGSARVRKPGKLLSKADWDAIEILYAANLVPVRQIAAQFGIAEGRISHRAHQARWPHRRAVNFDPKAVARMRLRRIIRVKLATLETQMAASQDLSPADSERQSREVASLLRSLATLDDMDAASKGESSAPKKSAPAPKPNPAPSVPEDDDDDRYWRDELKRSISALIAHRDSQATIANESSLDGAP